MQTICILVVKIYSSLTSTNLMVFDFLEWTLLQGKVTKKEHQQRSKETVPSVIPQVRQRREVPKKKGILPRSVSRPFPLS